jgi:hypothetical protein
MGAIHFAHTALPDESNNLVRTECFADRKRHLNESAKVYRIEKRIAPVSRRILPLSFPGSIRDQPGAIPPAHFMEVCPPNQDVADSGLFRHRLGGPLWWAKKYWIKRRIEHIVIVGCGQSDYKL